MLKAYRDHVAERAALGIPPLPLSAKQTGELIELLKAPPAGEEAFLVDLITHRVPAGVDDAAKVKASYLAAVAHGTETCALISRARATELLGTMLGGYNISPMVDLLDDAAVAAERLGRHVRLRCYRLPSPAGDDACWIRRRASLRRLVERLDRRPGQAGSAPVTPSARGSALARDRCRGEARCRLRYRETAVGSAALEPTYDADGSAIGLSPPSSPVPPSP